MRKIAIIGAGQSGLQLGIGLLDAGYKVTILTNRTADEIANGPITSSQVMFGPTIATERALGLEMWADEYPAMDRLSLSVADGQGGCVVDWAADLSDPSNSIDQRVKFPRWMAEFEKRGGELKIADVDVTTLETLSGEFDLVVVSSGKGEISRIFERDAERSEFDKPQRSLAMIYVNGMEPRAGGAKGGLSICPGAGEYLNFAALTLSGVCDIMLFEAIPGGPMDTWKDVAPGDLVEKAKSVLAEFFPWETKRCGSISMTDEKAVLRGAFPPTVRKPIGRLPSGKGVLGLGDVLVLNDPLAGRGSNGAAMAATRYLERIIARGDEAFDEAWMTDTFEYFWEWGQWGVEFTTVQLRVPPDPQLLKYVVASNSIPGLKNEFIRGLEDPSQIQWLMKDGETDKFLANFAS